MNKVTIQLHAGTEQKLRERAALWGISLEDYLQELAQRDAANGTVLSLEKGKLPLDEFDRLLEEISEGLPALPSLPADFSRKDIYGDHD